MPRSCWIVDGGELEVSRYIVGDDGFDWSGHGSKITFKIADVLSEWLTCPAGSPGNKVRHSYNLYPLAWT